MWSSDTAMYLSGDVTIQSNDGRTLTTSYLRRNLRTGDITGDSAYTLRAADGRSQSGVGFEINAAWTSLRCLQQCTDLPSALLPP